MDSVNLYKEIFTLASHLYERNGRIEGRALNNWLEAERIVRTLRKIAGKDGKRYILVNVPETRYAEKSKNGNGVNPRKKAAYRVIINSPKTVSQR
jgi:hypothetical protein